MSRELWEPQLLDKLRGRGEYHSLDARTLAAWQQCFATQDGIENWRLGDLVDYWGHRTDDP